MKRCVLVGIIIKSLRISCQLFHATPKVKAPKSFKIKDSGASGNVPEVTRTPDLPLRSKAPRTLLLVYRSLVLSLKSLILRAFLAIAGTQLSAL